MCPHDKSMKFVSQRLWVSSIYVLGFWITSVACLGLEPHTALRQAQHTTWSLESGAPSRIVDLAQTSDGYLWLASQTGLYRFDGQHFVPTVFPGTATASPDITSLSALSSNELWVGSRRDGIFQLQDGKPVHRFSTGEGLPRATVYSIRQDSHGEMCGAGAAGVYLLHNGKFARIWPAVGQPGRPAANLWMDSGGRLCFTTDGGGLVQASIGGLVLSCPGRSRRRSDGEP